MRFPLEIRQSCTPTCKLIGPVGLPVARKKHVFLFLQTFLIIPLDNYFPDILTWLEALGPEQLTIWVKFYVESEFQVENTRFLHPDLKI